MGDTTSAKRGSTTAAVREGGESLNGLRRRWARGEAALLGWLQIPSAFSAEALGRCDYDGLVVDMQHGPADLTTAIDMIRAIESSGGEPCVRLRQNDAGEIMKLLDMGATGLICPMIETAEQASAFSRALHYPPMGDRSYGPRRPLLKHGANYWRVASDTMVGMAMIETAQGLDNLDEILAIEGIDGVFVGPADLALSLGYDPVAHSAEAQVRDAIRQICDRARRARRQVGIFCTDSEQAAARISEGFTLVSLQPDLALMVEAASRSISVARGRAAQ
jgi:4-hydroxy-2-oxoheptanedioate aldolase